jgi:hypothetical protein
MYSWTDTQQADHEVSMRQGGVIIGKLWKSFCAVFSAV